MKLLTGAMATALSTIKGAEPVMIVAIDWGTYGNIFYADKALPSPALASGRVLKISNLSVVRQFDSFGEISSCSVELDDHDLHFWNLINVAHPEGKNVGIFQYFPNQDPNEILVLFLGKMVAPIVWSEGQRTLSFSVFTNYNDGSVGDVFTSDDYDGYDNFLTILDKNAVGKFAPIGFGNLLKSKTLKTLIPRVSLINDNIEVDDIQNNSIGWVPLTIEVEDGDLWPQGTPFNFTVDEISFSGKFDGSFLTISDVNIPTDMGGIVTYRDGADRDYNNYKVVWIPTTEKLVNKWVWFVDDTYGNIINYCTQQNGDKCTFQDSFIREKPDYTDPTSPFVFLMNGSVATQCALKYRYDWPILNSFFIYLERYTLPVGSIMIAETGMVYIANQLERCAIKQAYAYREIPNMIYNPDIDQYEQRGSTRKLCIIPSSYYSVNIIGTTSLIFNKRLGSYQSEFWDENEVFVTQTSTVGPNTSDIIEWILSNFTSLGIDFSSFNSVAGAIDNYPSNFVLSEPKKAIELCKNIAWQARCGLRIYDNTAYLVYLSELPAVLSTIDAPRIQYKSMEITYTDTERMYTRANVKFSVPSFVTTIKEEQNYVITNTNANIFGLKSVSWDFFIYDITDYVLKSVDFWLPYYANSWKKVKLKGFIDTLPLEIFDCVQLSFPGPFPIGRSLCRAIVEETSYDSEKFDVDLVLWLPMAAGTVIESNNFWVDDSSDGLDFINPTAGISPVDYIVPVGISQNKKHPNKYATVKTVDAEMDSDGNPTGRNTYTADVHPNGPENDTTQTLSDLRLIDPDQTTLVPGDVLEIQGVNGLAYLRNKTNDAVAFYYIETHADFVTGVVVDGDGSFVKIAKPYNLRRTPFDLQTIDGVSYVYVDDSTRLAENDTDSETQVITPSFSDFTIIHAVRNVRGQDVVDPDNDDEAIKWLMTDVYQWAVQDD